jgi:hypothetical protein
MEQSVIGQAGWHWHTEVLGQCRARDRHYNGSLDLAKCNSNTRGFGRIAHP